jgi:hypothetical protein
MKAGHEAGGRHSASSTDYFLRGFNPGSNVLLRAGIFARASPVHVTRCKKRCPAYEKSWKVRERIPTRFASQQEKTAVELCARTKKMLSRRESKNLKGDLGKFEETAASPSNADYDSLLSVI